MALTAALAFSATFFLPVSSIPVVSGNTTVSPGPYLSIPDENVGFGAANPESGLNATATEYLIGPSSSGLVVALSAAIAQTSSQAGYSSLDLLSSLTIPAAVQPTVYIPTDGDTTMNTPVTATVSAPPITVTQIITVQPSTTTSASSVTTAPPLASTWLATGNQTYLASFNVSYFPSGKDNVQIVQGIPANASLSTVAIAAQETGAPAVSVELQPTWDNTSSSLQVLYPAHSIDPAQDPEGGADFYASPLDLQDVTNVTLEYSVFFPVDFDWVQGGKLPGLYGGKTGCSGGNAALDCFSTRLMWRENGTGELYLYAPKDKQTKALCSDPQSVCDAEYGLSVGRGSFIYTPGAWTHLQQTVGLNNPGKQDGTFLLLVNGNEAIHRTDVFYRDEPTFSASTTTFGSKATLKAAAQPAKATKAGPASPSGDASGGLLGGLLGAVDDVDMLNRLFSNPLNLDTSNDTAGLDQDGDSNNPSDPSSFVVNSASTTLVSATPTSTVTQITTTTSYGYSIDPVNVEGQPTPVPFTGIFFSTFFGGHTEQYATPKDQYTWFANFGLRIND